VEQACKKQGIKIVGFVSDVGQLYKSADVLVFPTLEEGGPQVIYEAAGCGLPSITTSMGAGRLIKDGINGIIVKPYDIDGLANAIARLANSPELRKRLGEQAEKDVQAYTYERLGNERARILRDLLLNRFLGKSCSV
jgi:glycosyltransferase involved in cell wall biosynthesis